MTARLQHVSIPHPPGSAALTRSFYGDLLGLEEIPPPSSLQGLEVIWFKVGEAAELHIFREDPLQDASNRHFCLMMDKASSLRQTLEAAGYAPWDAAVIPGRPRFFCRDPFGNIIEFTSIEADYLDFQDSRHQP